MFIAEIIAILSILPIRIRPSSVLSFLLLKDTSVPRINHATNEFFCILLREHFGDDICMELNPYK